METDEEAEETDSCEEFSTAPSSAADLKLSSMALRDGAEIPFLGDKMRQPRGEIPSLTDVMRQPAPIICLSPQPSLLGTHLQQTQPWSIPRSATDVRNEEMCYQQKSNTAVDVRPKEFFFQQKDPVDVGPKKTYGQRSGAELVQQQQTEKGKARRTEADGEKREGRKKSGLKWMVAVPPTATEAETVPVAAPVVAMGRSEPGRKPRKEVFRKRKKKSRTNSETLVTSAVATDNAPGVSAAETSASASATSAAPGSSANESKTNKESKSKTTLYDLFFDNDDDLDF